MENHLKKYLLKCIVSAEIPVTAQVLFSNKIRGNGELRMDN